MRYFLSLILLPLSLQAQTPPPAAKARAEKTPVTKSKDSKSNSVTPSPTPAPTVDPKALLLSQRRVAELALTQGGSTMVSNLRADLPRFDYATALAKYDFTLSANAGYEMSKFENFAGTQNAKDETYKASVKLVKPWITGTNTTFEWTRNSLQSLYYTPTTPTILPPTAQTQDIFALTVEQNLWRNFFGVADRATVRAATENLNAAVVTRANSLQENVLNGLIKYWNSYVAEEALKEALAARERYKKLSDNVRRKTGYGYSAPGELPQIRSELETKEQDAKRKSFAYLLAIDDLLIYLGIPAGTPIVFEPETVIPKPPVLPKIEVTELRAYKAQELRYKAAQENVAAARSNRDPNLSLVGQLYGSGIEEKANDALAESISGSRPKYYVGVKFEVPFGSDLQNETLVNRQILARIEEINRDLLLQNVELNLADQERQVIGLYAIVQSLTEEREQRERAMNEINRAYTQGRIDIRQTIESLNAYSTSKINYSRAVGDYQIALARLASARDELIPSPKEGTK